MIKKETKKKKKTAKAKIKKKKKKTTLLSLIEMIQVGTLVMIITIIIDNNREGGLCTPLHSLFTFRSVNHGWVEK